MSVKKIIFLVFSFLISQLGLSQEPVSWQTSFEKLDANEYVALYLIYIVILDLNIALCYLISYKNYLHMTYISLDESSIDITFFYVRACDAFRKIEDLLIRSLLYIASRVHVDRWHHKTYQ